MALDGQPCRTVSGAQRGVGARAPAGPGGRLHRRGRPGGLVSQLLLHDSKEARPIARLVTSREAADPARAAGPAPPLLPSDGLPDQLDLKSALRVDVALGSERSLARRPAGSHHRPSASRLAPAFTGQGRSRRRFGPDQPRRETDRLSPPWPPLPAAGPARRRLEAVLAGYARGRARPDPTCRLRGGNAGHWLIEIDGDGLGGAAAGALIYVV